MKLTTKFNLALLAVFIPGLLAASYVSYTVMHKHAREEVLNHAGMMMEAALAIRGYTVKEIRPLLTLQMKREFLPQSVPSYAATQNFTALRDSHPEYTYKEAALNPTNPRDKATDWEADIIQSFRNDGARTEITGERDTPTGRSLFYARPIVIRDRGCLTCHSTAEEAPETMIRLYGTSNGFGWQHNEVIGSQIVSVPLSVAVAKTNQEVAIFMGSLVAIFLTIIVSLNILLRTMVISRVRNIAEAAEQISTGNADVAEFHPKGHDEIAELSTAFNRMRRSLERAMKMLDDEDRA
jgi:protein-histidine pros-kinase